MPTSTLEAAQKHALHPSTEQELHENFDLYLQLSMKKRHGNERKKIGHMKIREREKKIGHMKVQEKKGKNIWAHEGPCRDCHAL